MQQSVLTQPCSNCPRLTKPAWLSWNPPLVCHDVFIHFVRLPPLHFSLYHLHLFSSCYVFLPSTVLISSDFIMWQNCLPTEDDCGCWRPSGLLTRPMECRWRSTCMTCMNIADVGIGRFWWRGELAERCCGCAQTSRHGNEGDGWRCRGNGEMSEWF